MELIDVVQRLKLVTDYDQCKAAMNDAIAEILTLRAKLSKPQPTPSQSVDETAEFKRYNKIRYPRSLFGHEFEIAIDAWKARAQLSKPQPTSQDVGDAERYRYLRNRNAFEVLTGKGIKAGVWIDCESDDKENTLVLLTGIDADDMIDVVMKESKP